MIMTRIRKTLFSLVTAAVALTALSAPPALAQGWDHDGHGGPRGGDWHGEGRGDPHWVRPDWRPAEHYPDRFVMVPGRGRFEVPEFRRRFYNGIPILRPFGPMYGGYGFYYSDAEAFRWLGLTAITLAVLDSLNEAQQRALENAQVQATMAPVGTPIMWNNGPASGSVVTLRDGRAADGAYCREFQQNVIIGGQTQQAYGTACQQPDGAWRVVNGE